jgi:putative Mg2+ transporter-C (MgtC) family protein
VVLASLDTWNGGEVVLQLVVATVLSGAIGLERQFRGRPAGLRTHILVCLGATMAMLAASQVPQLDPGRIAAGVLTGIGFIGAGAILRLKDTHRGLTTAACVWFVAALGVAVSVRSYTVAVGATGLALAVLIGLRYVERLIRPHTYRELVLVAERREGIVEQALGLVRGLGVGLRSYDVTDDIEQGTIDLSVSVRFRERELGREVLETMHQLPGLRSVTWRFPSSD